ncbi:MAG: hypothetical protein R3D57_14180 [Hyphomicrobiaceae bacterium]
MIRVAYLCLLVVAASTSVLVPAVQAKALRSPAIDAMIAISETASRNFQDNAFDKLEAQAKAYRDKNYRIPNGDYALTLFYDSMIWHSARGDEKNARLAQTEKWMRRYSRSPTPYVAHVIQLINSYHGLGQLIAVNEQAGLAANAGRYKEKAKRYLADAQRLLTNRRSIAAKDPYYFVVSMMVSSLRGDDEKKLMKTFEAGLRSAPGYSPFHKSALVAFEQLQPGNKQRIEDLVRRIVAVQPEDEKAITYAQAYWLLAGHYGRIDTMFRTWAIDWSLFKQGMADTLVRYPDESNGSWFARFACLAGDEAKIRELWSMAERFPHPGIWNSPFEFQMCQAVAESKADESTTPAELPDL